MVDLRHLSISKNSSTTGKFAPRFTTCKFASARIASHALVFAVVVIIRSGSVCGKLLDLLGGHRFRCAKSVSPAMPRLRVVSFCACSRKHFRNFVVEA